jgi:hypothetical protein
LDGTDWASLTTAYGTGESLPAALARLLDPSPAVRATAAKDALDAVTHQNTIYEATVPVAMYVAAILNHPATATGDFGRGTRASHYPTRAALLDWLSATAYDANDECVAMGERICGDGFLDACQDMRVFRDLRPAIFSAVFPLLDHDDAKVRDAALVCAIPLTEHPVLTPHRGDLVGHACRLLATSTDRYKRDRVLEALKAWGHDIAGLENAGDIAARELRDRIDALDFWTGGSTEDPPF